MAKNTTYWLLIYIANLFSAFLFSKAVQSLYPAQYLLVATGVAGLSLSCVFNLVLKLLNAEFSNFKRLFWATTFQITQTSLIAALAYFIFKLPSLYLVALFAQALLSLLLLLFVSQNDKKYFAPLALVLGALSVTISLRVGGVYAAALSVLMTLNVWPLAARLLSENQKIIFSQILSFWGLLVVGRCAIQYYLIESGYDALGVVISHPYSFAALFAGFSLPLCYIFCVNELRLSRWVLVFALGAILPFALGLIFHVRPMGGFLMGLLCSSYCVGILKENAEDLIISNLLTFAVLCFSIPLFKLSLHFVSWINLLVLAATVFLMALLSFASYSFKPRNGSSHL